MRIRISRIGALLCTVLLLGGSFSLLPVGAETDTELLFHYDFSGETDADRLANKATGRDTGALRLVGGASKVCDGYAVVDSAKGNYLTVPMGDDVRALGNRATFSVVFRATGDHPTSFGDIAGIGNVVRLAVNTKNQPLTRVGNEMTSSEATQFFMKETVLPRGIWIHLAVSLETEENGTVHETVYISVDGGKTYSRNTYTAEQVGGMFPSAGDMLLGKVTTVIADRGTSFAYQDIRLWRGLADEALLRQVPVNDPDRVPDPAEDDGQPPRDIGKYLVVHYDFLGDSEDEQLRDKAPAGVSQENLLLYSSVDEENRKRSYIREGVAYIDRAQSNFLFAMPGEDLTGLTESMTVFLTFNPSVAECTQPCDAFAMDNTCRIALHNRNYLFTRAGTGSLGSVGADSEPVARGEWIRAVATFTWNRTTGTVYQRMFVSLDDGATWQESNGTATGVTSMFSDTTYLILGKVKSTMADRGTSFRIKDVQIYNTALRKSELSLLTVKEYEPNGQDGDKDGAKEPESESVSTTQPSEAPSEEADIATAEKTEPDGGCRAAWSGSVLLPLIPVLFAALRKRRHS